MCKFVNMKIFVIVLALVFASCEKEYTEPVETKESLGMYRVAADPRLPYIGTWSSNEYCGTYMQISVDTIGQKDLIVNNALVLKPLRGSYVYNDSLNEVILKIDSVGFLMKYWSPPFTCSDYLQ